MPRRVTIHTVNNDFQYVDTLRRNRTKRTRAREFVVEGVRQIDEALRAGWSIRAFLYSRDRPLSGWAQGILSSSQAEQHFELSQTLLAKLSGKEETSELLAVVGMREDDLSRIPLRADLCVVIADRPASPGNLGTLIRSCDAFGVHGLIICGHATDLYDPETVSASTGSLFSLPAVRVASPTDVDAWLASVRATIGRCQLVGTSAHGAGVIAEHDLTGPTILVVGNETRGLSAHFRGACDALVRIPIGGSATSLNLACATTVALYELRRQRGNGAR